MCEKKKRPTLAAIRDVLSLVPREEGDWEAAEGLWEGPGVSGGGGPGRRGSPVVVGKLFCFFGGSF